MTHAPSPRDVQRYGRPDIARFGPPPPPFGMGGLLLGPDASAAPFRPDSLSGLTLWVEGQAGLPGSGFISTWFDQSSHNRQLQSSGSGAGRQPTVGTLNGQTAVDMTTTFTGTGGWLEIFESDGSTTTTWSNLVSPTGFSMFALFRYSGAVAFSNTITMPCAILDPNDDDIGMYLGVTSSNLTAGLYYGAPSHAVSSTGGASSIGHQVYVAFDNTNIYAQVDSTNSVTSLAAPSRTTIADQINVGTSGTSNWFQGVMGALIIYNRFLTTGVGSETAKVQAYLASKWSVL